METPRPRHAWPPLRLRHDIEREFGRASVKSPIVQLNDGTWINFVPCDPSIPRRRLELWYPADVDTGVLHLPRLGALDASGPLATAMLHDHEDNLFLNQWGAANEPVYNMQGTVYLLRDDANAAIRTFYSTMACAFSHGQFEPVEHRWAWGQYFGPPSTDGAWFELYRNMLLSDLGAHNELFIARAVPRAWLADGNRIRVQHAPTCFGRVSFQITSAVQSNTIQASVEFLDQRRPAALLVRLRHPQAKPIKSVTVNGAPWNNVDPSRETVRIPNPSAKNYLIIARYDK